MFCGCGYRLAEMPGAEAGVAAPRVAIETLRNDSGEPGLDRLVSEALRREWIRRGAYRLVSDPDSADWVLRGRVAAVQTSSQTLSSVVLVLEHTVTLALALQLDERAGSTIRLPPSLLRESELYLASADLEVARKNRREALRRVAGLLAERVHDAVDARVLQ